MCSPARTWRSIVLARAREVWSSAKVRCGKIPTTPTAVFFSVAGALDRVGSRVRKLLRCRKGRVDEAAAPRWVEEYHNLCRE